MNKQLPIHPSTKKALSAFIAQPSHAVIIYGSAGSGKYALAQKLASELLSTDLAKVDEHPYLTHIKPEDKKSIGIDQIRQLLTQLNLIVPSSQAINRAVIVSHADMMTLEAQNAFLKALEEPPKGTVLVLLSDHDTLLPTIKSRAQSIRVHVPDERELTEYFVDQGFSQKQIKQALTITGGLPELTSDVLADTDHIYLLASAKAKDILKQSSYERLTSLDELTKDPVLLDNTLNILTKIAEYSLNHSAQYPERWQKILESVDKTKQDLNRNAQPKLALSSLMLSI